MRRINKVFLLAAAIAMVGMTTMEMAYADSWETLAPETKPSARYGHIMVELDDTVYIFGGMTADRSSKGASSELWKWDKAANKWVAVTPAASPPERHSHSATTSDKTETNKMYVFNGAKSDGSLHSDIWSYNPATMKWETEAFSGNAPAARSQHSTVKLSDGRIMLFGGLLENDATDENAYIYDPSTGNWVIAGATFPDGYRYGQSMISASGKVYVFGGQGPDGATNSMWAYDPADDYWQLLSQAIAPLPRLNHAVAISGNLMWIFGGQDENGLEFPETWEYYISENTWEMRPMMPAPLTRTAAAVLPSQKKFTNRKVQTMLFGGKSVSSPIDTTYRYTANADLGDVNADGFVDLRDAVLALQIVIGLNKSGSIDADVNGDGEIGMEEVIFILQEIAIF